LLSGSLEKKAHELKDSTHEGLEKLDVLWEKWKQCVGEIQRLAADEAAFAEGRETKHYGSGKVDGNRSGMVNNGEGWGELEYAALVERIKSVGEVWVEKMEECEKVRALPIFFTTSCPLLVTKISHFWPFAANTTPVSPRIKENRGRGTQAAASGSHCPSLRSLRRSSCP